MSMRPIDLQVLLKQTATVAKLEKSKKDIKRAAQVDRDKNAVMKNSETNEGINDVDKVEVDGNVIREKEKERDYKSSAKKKKPNDKDEKSSSHLKEKYKGNFLDILE